MLANGALRFQPENTSMPRGRPRNDAGINKMEAMRRTLTALGDDVMPKAFHDHIKKSLGFEMSLGMISNYKSTVKSEGSRSRLRHEPGPTEIAGAFSFAEIHAVHTQFQLA